MQLIHPGPDEAMLCLRAVRTTVAHADGEARARLNIP
jgi:hypothetical protein